MILWTRINLKSEKGNAMIMALSIIFILTAFGTVSLMSSLANMHMGAKYKDWSKDYYALDFKAEDKVNALSGQLETAETNAQKYMAEHYYTKDVADIEPTDPLKVQNDAAQHNIYEQWQQGTLADDDKQTFMKNTLKRIYFYYASNLIQTNLQQSDGYTTTYLKTNAANIDENIDNDGDPANDLANYQNELLFTDALDSLKLIENIDTTDDINPAVNGKSVAVKVHVKLPTYDMIAKNIIFKGNPIWTNAITAAGSIGFEGQESGTGQCEIAGDVFSADKDESLPINNTLVGPTGIYSDRTKVDIYGNVYSKGDLHIIGSTPSLKATINVKKYEYYADAIDTDLKNKVFSSNDLFFDTATAIDIANLGAYTEDTAPVDAVPFVYKDIKGGNIYCNTLSVENVADSGQIMADGNVTTYDDIQMDGLNSDITVAGNYIGVNSDSVNGDPNASSSVINNTALEALEGSSKSSTITLNGKFIVPGTAWAALDFTGIKKYGATSWDWNSNDRYYQTGESITAKNDNIFSSYLINPSNNNVYDEYTNDQQPADETMVHFYSLLRGDPDVPEPKIHQLVNFLTGKNVVTNVNSGSIVDGYSLGATILHQPHADYATVYDPFSAYGNYTKNQDAYEYFKLALASIFQSKTQNIGTDGTDAAKKRQVNNVNGFDGFVDEDVFDSNSILRLAHDSTSITTDNSFVYIPLPLTGASFSTLDLPDGQIYKGIIYCKGDLHITGNGSYNGAIICKGKVTVTGNPTIAYDEKVIKKVLDADVDVRRFFAPGAIKNIESTEYDGVRKDVTRYDILEWKEGQS